MDMSLGIRHGYGKLSYLNDSMLENEIFNANEILLL